MFNKTIILFIFLIQNSAFAWKTLVSCDNGRMRIEKECYSAPSQYGGGYCYNSRKQLVIQDDEVVRDFVQKRAYGFYSHNGGNQIYKNEVLVNLDAEYWWGYSGGYLYKLDIPYADDTIRISYWIDIDKYNNVLVKAVANRNSVYGLIRVGELASKQYFGCYVER